MDIHRYHIAQQVTRNILLSYLAHPPRFVKGILYFVLGLKGGW